MEKFWAKVGSTKGIIKGLMIGVVTVGGLLLIGNSLMAPVDDQEMLPAGETTEEPETTVDETEA